MSSMVKRYMFPSIISVVFLHGPLIIVPHGPPCMGLHRPQGLPCPPSIVPCGPPWSSMALHRPPCSSMRLESFITEVYSSILQQEKCTRYWPAQGSEGYGSVQVTLVQQAAHGVYNTSTLQVQANGGEVKTVTHYRLTFWPHQGVPKDTKTLTDFLR